MTVVYEELAGSPHIAITQQGATAVRSFRVDWSDWQAFAQMLLGTYGEIGGTSRFVQPIPFPGFKNLLVAEITVDPFDPDSPDTQTAFSLQTDTNAYRSGAKVTAVYKTQFDGEGYSLQNLPRVPNGTYLVYRSELGAEYQHVPGRVWRWSSEDDPPVPDDVNPGVLIPTGSVQLSWLRVPAPPWSAIRALRGKVNASPFLGSPVGTVLFMGVKAVREFQMLKEGGVWRLDYYFSEQTKERSGGDKVGWNYFYKEQAAEGEHWVAIQDADGGAPYGAADFQDLFQFE
ncbi:MAG: hypothetical protein K8U03_06630 [Planctomycetia bacterium]|nr:hypothetical protein [Planctomycetia bacterium]